jgi:hypothetical protein
MSAPYSSSQRISPGSGGLACSSARWASALEEHPVALAPERPLERRPEWVLGPVGKRGERVLEPSLDVQLAQPQFRRSLAGAREDARERLAQRPVEVADHQLGRPIEPGEEVRPAGLGAPREGGHPPQPGPLRLVVADGGEDVEALAARSPWSIRNSSESSASRVGHAVGSSPSQTTGASTSTQFATCWPSRFGSRRRPRQPVSSSWVRPAASGRPEQPADTSHPRPRARAPGRPRGPRTSTRARRPGPPIAPAWSSTQGDGAQPSPCAATPHRTGAGDPRSAAGRASAGADAAASHTSPPAPPGHERGPDQDNAEPPSRQEGRRPRLRPDEHLHPSRVGTYVCAESGTDPQTVQPQPPSQRFGFSTIICSSCSSVMPRSFNSGMTRSNRKVIDQSGTSFAFR